MGREGLRTLVMGYKEISIGEYERFGNRLDRANSEMNNRKRLVEECWREMENELTLLGVTGVEDKLQERVSETIECLRNANIKVWMLTGDKLETAKCIAIATGIKAAQEEIFTIAECVDPLQLHNLLIEFSNKLHDHILLIDG